MTSSKTPQPSPSLDVAELVEQHSGPLFGLARRLTGCQADAEDLVQQTFLAAHAHGDQLRDPERTRGWLCTILRNEFLKMLRQRKRARTVSLESVGDTSAPMPAGEGVDAEAIQQALDGLPDDYRLPVVLYYFQEMSYREIAEELDVPIGTVMSRLSRGKAQLRRRLQPAMQPAASPPQVAKTG